MSGKDLGTYHVKVVFTDGSGFIMSWPTSARFIGGGTESTSPLSAKWTPPIYDDESDVVRNMVYMFTTGNYACDCNRYLFLGRTGEYPHAVIDRECGHSLSLGSFVVIRPDGSEMDLSEWARSEEADERAAAGSTGGF